jgi:hypothetical protein
MDVHRAGGRPDADDGQRAVLLLTQPFDFIVDPVIDKVRRAWSQWHWLEVETGVPISDAMADRLAPYSASAERR